MSAQVAKGVAGAHWPPEIAALAAPGAEPVRSAIGGRAPEAVLAPDSLASAAAVVGFAARSGLAVAPLGGGTGRGELDAPDRPFVALSTRGLHGIVEHTAPDMTVIVRAGTTLAALGAALAACGQRLPIDVPAPDRATVGGLIASNRSGPLRLGHGTVRDYLIGIAVLDAGGNLVRAGGRVVKNVAGYDLMKLHAGARGTLGLIVEAAFKVVPLADETACVTGRIAPEGAERVRIELRRAQVPAVALELASLGAADRDTGRLVVGLEGVSAEIEWQVGIAAAILGAAGAGAIETWRGPAASDLLRSLAEFGAAGGAGGGGDGGAGSATMAGDPTGPTLGLRAAVLPSRTPELWRAFAVAAPRAELQASAGSGLLRLRWPAPAGPESERGWGPEQVARLRALAVELGGHAVVEALPGAWEGAVDRFGRAPDPLMVGLEASLDPEHLYLPGSYCGLGAGARAR